VLRDKEKGVFTDASKVHPIQHDGKYFKVPGFHLCEPSPQRTPVIFQAGASSRGRRFAAARHAEAMFILATSPENRQKTDRPDPCRSAGRRPRARRAENFYAADGDHRRDRRGGRSANMRNICLTPRPRARWRFMAVGPGSIFSSLDPDTPLARLKTIVCAPRWNRWLPTATAGRCAT